MKKIIVLAALAFALGTVHQASACDFGAHAANATPIVVAKTEAPTSQQPAAKRLSQLRRRSPLTSRLRLLASLTASAPIAKQPSDSLTTAIPRRADRVFRK